MTIDTYGKALRLRPRSTRAYLRRLLIANAVSYLAVNLGLLLFFWDNMRLSWHILFANLPFMVTLAIGVTDIWMVYRFARKIQPVTPLHGAWLAFVYGASWKEMRQLIEEIGPKLQARERLIAMINDDPGLKDKQALLSLVEEGQYMKVSAILQGDKTRRERAAARAAAQVRRRETEAARLIRQGVELGVPEAEMIELVAAGKGAAAARVRLEREAAAIRTAAEKLGCSHILGDLDSDDACRAARSQLATVVAMLEEGGRLQVRTEVAQAIVHGSLSDGLSLLARTRKEAEAAKALEAYRARVESLPAAKREAPEKLLEHMQRAEFGSRSYRKLQHDLDALLH